MTHGHGNRTHISESSEGVELVALSSSDGRCGRGKGRRVGGELDGCGQWSWRIGATDGGGGGRRWPSELKGLLLPESGLRISFDDWF